METLERNHPEARFFDSEKRLYDDTTTWLAEVLDGSMRTPFEYRFDGHELYSRDGSALKQIFEKALSEAEHIAARQPDLSFEVRRRKAEMEEYNAMIEMAKGNLPNTMVVVSDFPPELMQIQESIGGYNAERKQTMLRLISRTPEGGLRMVSQSLEGSYTNGLEAIYRSLGFAPMPGELLGQRMHVELPSAEQEFLVDHLMGVYDRSLSKSLGGEYYAGRKTKERTNTYDFVRAQGDLVQEFMKRAYTPEDSKSLLYNLAAAIRQRFERSGLNTEQLAVVPLRMQAANPLQEMQIAGRAARAEGRSFDGCGLSLKAEGEISAADELSEMGYGNKSEEDKYGPLTFQCPKGHTNRRPRNQLIERCKTCGTSVKC